MIFIFHQIKTTNQRFLVTTNSKTLFKKYKISLRNLELKSCFFLSMRSLKNLY